MEINLESKTINELCVGKDGKRLRFHIPSYQRGYRWTSHVTRLMDDIFDFAEAKDNNLNVGRYYCLQPIIMKHRQDLDYIPENGQSEMGYEVVDGQQRLTTIFILLKVLSYPLEDDIFRISFQRDGHNGIERESFLNSVDTKIIDEHQKVDFHYFHDAFTNAKKWLEEKKLKIGSNPR
jgi:uncharacterized protein with ParB-like and HNH nuclease domain